MPPAKHHNSKAQASSWRRVFLVALAERGNISAATRIAGVDRRLAYQARKRSEAFAAQWDEALAVAVDTLEEEAWDRSKARTDDKASATLLIFLLKAHRRELYGYANVNGNGHTDDAAVLIAEFVKQMGRNGGSLPVCDGNVKSNDENNGNGHH